MKTTDGTSRVGTNSVATKRVGTNSVGTERLGVNNVGTEELEPKFLDRRWCYQYCLY